VEQLERRVLAGIKMRLRDPELLAEFIHEFGLELKRLQEASAEENSAGKKKLEEIKQKIARIVTAIVDGTDTPTLRQTLISLEGEKVERERDASPRIVPVERPPVPDLAVLFRRKVEALETALNTEPNITTAAASILRTLINAIVLYPREKPGNMPVQVYGDPSALCLVPKDEKSKGENWMITVVAEEGLEPPTRGL
jgi:hypothetical protein